MEVIAATPQAYQLVHEGAQALAAVEAAGMRVDEAYLRRAREQVKAQIDAGTSRLKQTEVWRVWQRAYGDKASLGSRVQLGEVLFEKLRVPCANRTPSGRPSTAQADLEELHNPFVRKYLQLEKLKKLHSTYLTGILREVDHGYLHPFFNLHLVVSYRSSSDSPNFQNIPARNPEIAQVIRRAFVPRPGRVLVEIDYSAIEVRVAACYHRDPTMLKYIESAYDMHRDMAAQCFLLQPSQVTKQARHAGKNGFVFPSFYGDYHTGISANMWRMIERDRLATQDGVPLKQHLREQGIRNLQQFDRHIEQVEQDFWGRRFRVYDEWRRQWWQDYQQTGWFRLHTGFVCQGSFKRNEVINLPVQGAAFHCLLWSLIKLQRWLREQRLQTLIVGQIHDSIMLDVVESELDEVVGAARKVMCEDLRRAWDWIITPLDTEAAVCRENWWDKEPLTDEGRGTLSEASADEAVSDGGAGGGGDDVAQLGAADGDSACDLV